MRKTLLLLFLLATAGPGWGQIFTSIAADPVARQAIADLQLEMPGNGSFTFQALADVPVFSGQGGKVLAVTGDELGIEWVPGGGGSAPVFVREAVYTSTATNTVVFPTLTFGADPGAMLLAANGLFLDPVEDYTILSSDTILFTVLLATGTRVSCVQLQ